MFEVPLRPGRPCHAPWRILILLAFVACVAAAATDTLAASTAAADLRGIYVFTSDVSQISHSTATALQTSLGVPGMDGIVVVIGWNAIEPAMGQFDWSLLDTWVSLAVTARKKIALAILAGDSTPSWLFQGPPSGPGAHQLTFTISPHGGATGQCQSTVIAPPWDTAFLARWDAMLVALSAHLKTAGTYNAITIMKLTGVNRTTEEFRLPAESAQSTGLACVSDAPAIWQQAGYRPSLLLGAWDQITGSFQKSFPDKAFSVAIIPTNAFPPINENGTIVKANPPDQNTPLLTQSSQKFPGHLVVQFDFLMPGEAASPAVVQAAQTLGTLAAFQTNEYLGSTGQGAACSEPVTNPTPCTLSTYLALLQTGIYPLGPGDPLRAQYIEVFHANATAFPGDILQAHDELIPTSRRHAVKH